MELGAHLPLISFTGEHRGLDHLVAYARAAHDLGYGWLCANDHLTFARPWLDGPTSLAAVIGASGDLRLATTVALPAVRGAAPTAKALGAIDLLSGGRLTAGVGPGSSAADHALVGQDFDDRWRRLDRAVDALRAHWADGPDRLEPAPAQPGGPPIWIGSWGSPAGLRRVARRGDGWLASAYNTTPATFATARRDLDALLAAEGRDATSFPDGISTLWAHVTDERAEADRVLDDVLAPMLRRDPAALREQIAVGPPGLVADRLAAYEAAGAQRVFVWPVTDDLRQLERVVATLG